MDDSNLPIQIPAHLAKQTGTTGGRLLEIERAKASFSPAELETYLYGQDYIDRRSRILSIVENEVRFPLCVPPLVLATPPTPSEAK